MGWPSPARATPSVDEHAAFRAAAHREGLCPKLWSEMEEIRASAQHGGYSYRFYTSSDTHPGYLIRVRHRPGERHSPDEWVAGRWTSGRCFWLTGGCTGSLGGPPANLLLAFAGAAGLTFFSLLVVGWLTAPIGAALGLAFGFVGRPNG